MRHSITTLLVAILAMTSMNALAQPGLVYTPFIPEQSSSTNYGGWNNSTGSSRSRFGSYRPSYQTQIIQTTAYYADMNGYYYKIPIRVNYTVYSNGASSLTVAEQWESNGFSGQWKRVLEGARVVSCQAIFANGVSADLERSFMYKAMVGTCWYYFDL